MHARDGGDWNGCKDAKELSVDPFGGVINIPEFDAGNITFVSNKKSSVDSLIVWDNCTENVNDSALGEPDPAVIQLPKNEDGYFVYARILGKPVNSQNNPGDNSTIILTPEPALLSLCNDNATAISGFGEFISCSDGTSGMMPIAVIGSGSDGLFDINGVLLEKWQTSGKGKGKTTALNMTDQFLWSGSACSENLDTNNSGAIDLLDFDVEPEGALDGIVNGTDVDFLVANNTITHDFASGDLLVDAVDAAVGANTNDEVDAGDEFDVFLNFLDQCVVTDTPIWVFNAADLVIYGLEALNDGATNTQIRFYNASSTNLITSPDP